MPVNTRELIDAVSIIAENQNIRVTVKSSLKASCLVAGTTFAGSMVSNWIFYSSGSCSLIYVHFQVFGPLGIPIGATLGGLYAYSQAQGRKSGYIKQIKHPVKIQIRNFLHSKTPCKLF